MTICTHDSLAGGVNYIKSNLQSKKIGFSRGVALPYALAGGSFWSCQICSHTKVV